MNTNNVLRVLIRACVDDQRTLCQESKWAEATRGETLTRLASEREQFVADLERLGSRQESHDGSWSELRREVGRAIWVAAAGPNNGDAITACRHSRARTEARYDQALKARLPDEIQRIVAMHRRCLHDETDELNALQF